MKKSRKTGSLYLPKFVAEGEGFESTGDCPHDIVRIFTRAIWTDTQFRPTNEREIHAATAAHSMPNGR